MSPPEDHPARRVPTGRYGPRSGPGDGIGIAQCLGVLDSVVRRSFLAGFALENVHASVGPQPGADVDLALGQLDEIVREVRDIAFQWGSADARIQPAGPSDVSESGTV
jgi:hypothetical protein